MFSFEVEQQESATHITIGGELTIYSADSLLNQHIKSLSGDSDLSFDLSGVEEVDTAGIQILLVLHRACTARSKKFELLSLSEPVTRYLELFNLIEVFSLDPLVD